MGGRWVMGGGIRLGDGGGGDGWGGGGGERRYGGVRMAVKMGGKGGGDIRDSAGRMC